LKGGLIYEPFAYIGAGIALILLAILGKQLMKTASDRTSVDNDRIKAVVLTSVLFGVVVALTAGVTAFLALKQTQVSIIYSLPLVLIVGIVIFLATVSMVVAVFKLLGLTDARHALGLPEGSVRAFIALGLILLFFILVVFLYADVSAPQSRRLQGVTQAQADAIPGEQIRSKVAAGEGRFNLEVTRPHSEAGQDIAKQVVTTVSTLVVAIAAFYFGATSVQQAAGSTPGLGSAPPKVSSISPSRGPTKGGTEVTIKGVGLTGVTTIKFGEAEALKAEFVSDEVVIGTSPPHPAGVVDVTVTTPQGISVSSLTSRFTYTDEPLPS
jgi:hypothetical protein